MNSDPVLMFAAAAEARQSHPIAHAILAAAAELNLHLSAIDQAHYEVGYGLKVRLVSNNIEPFRSGEPTRQRHLSDHPTICVGSGRFMTLEGIELPAQIETLTETCQAQGHSLVMVAVDDELVGCIELQPTMRPEAQRIVEGNLNQLLQLFQLAGEYERNIKRNVRFTTGVSLVAFSGILFALVVWGLGDCNEATARSSKTRDRAAQSTYLLTYFIFRNSLREKHHV